MATFRVAIARETGDRFCNTHRLTVRIVERVRRVLLHADAVGGCVRTANTVNREWPAPGIDLCRKWT